MKEADVREQLSRLLSWEDAHAGFDKVVADIPPAMRGQTPMGLPYSPWQLVEHLRRTQRDILDFCINENYQELQWPAAYWPESATPPSDEAWEESLRGFREDRAALQRLAEDERIDLTKKIPHGSGQTYLREIVLEADHAAYHIGELLVVRRLLGIWSE